MTTYKIDRIDDVLVDSATPMRVARPDVYTPATTPAVLVTYMHASGSVHHTSCYRTSDGSTPAVDGRLTAQGLESLPSGVMAAVEECLVDGEARSVEA